MERAHIVMIWSFGFGWGLVLCLSSSAIGLERLAMYKFS
jgi:hypothetical protein